ASPRGARIALSSNPLKGRGRRRRSSPDRSLRTPADSELRHRPKGAPAPAGALRTSGRMHAGRHARAAAASARAWLAMDTRLMEPAGIEPGRPAAKGRARGAPRSGARSDRGARPAAPLGRSRCRLVREQVRASLDADVRHEIAEHGVHVHEMLTPHLL